MASSLRQKCFVFIRNLAIRYLRISPGIFILSGSGNPTWLPFQKQLQAELDKIKSEGLFKRERTITSAQAAEIDTVEGGKVLNFCANNYLGLSSHPEVVKAAKETIDTHGFGMSSVRFICGTQDIHKTLESLDHWWCSVMQSYEISIFAQWHGLSWTKTSGGWCRSGET